MNRVSVKKAPSLYQKTLAISIALALQRKATIVTRKSRNNSATSLLFDADSAFDFGVNRRVLLNILQHSAVDGHTRIFYVFCFQ